MDNKNWINSKEMIEMTEMIKALGHPSRIAILYLISNDKEGKMTVKSLYNFLKMPQPVISRHLIILKNGGLLQRQVVGASTYYALDRKNANVKIIEKCFQSKK